MAKERRFIEGDRVWQRYRAPRRREMESEPGLRTERGSRGGGPDSLRWFWSLTVNGPMTRSDKMTTLEEAKAQFQKSWECLEGMGEAGRRDGQIVINFCDDNSHS